ncbi:PQQ-binding-like beta-propeller repeat protein [Halorubellus litoreus]|uniref:PQQ-binding-like beta-propeller repeat protein n=1 Tax=Halorubellus litoreus TaxID=755308 RepID=A0ABD5VJ66_9EURY
MPSMTRRRALAAAVGVATGTAGCTALTDDDEFPVERAWRSGLDEPAGVATTDGGQLLAGSTSPFTDDPLVAALDATTGDITWTVTVEKGLKSPVAVADQRAYAFSMAETAVAVDATSGDVVWQTPLQAVDAADPGVADFAPIPLDDSVVLPISGTEDDVPDRLLALERDTGEERFTHDLAASLSGPPARADSGVIAPLVDGRVVALDATGRVQWTHEVGAPLSGVSATDGLAVVGAATEELLAFDADAGQVTWRGSLQNTVFAPPLVTSQRVYAGGADYVLRAFDAASGRELWRDELANAITHGPFLVGDRLVTLVGGDRRVRGHSGTIPFSPTTLYVHERDGTRVREVRLDAGYVDGGQLLWLQPAGDAVYLGQTFALSKVAPEAITDA